MTAPLESAPQTAPPDASKTDISTASIYGADGAQLPPKPETPASGAGNAGSGNEQVAQASPPPGGDQYKPLHGHYLGAGSQPQKPQEQPKDVVDGSVVGGAMFEAGLATIGTATLIAREIRTGDNGTMFPPGHPMGIGTNGRDLLARYGNLGAIETQEPDPNAPGRLVPVTRVVRVESLIGATDPVTGKKMTQIDLSNRTLSTDAMHNPPYLDPEHVHDGRAPVRTSFYQTYNQLLDTRPLGGVRVYEPTQAYRDLHPGVNWANVNLLDHLSFVATELRAHRNAAEGGRLSGRDVQQVATGQTAIAEELKRAGNELRIRISAHEEYGAYRRMRENEDLHDRTTIFSGIGDDATFRFPLLAKRFLAGSTVMGAGALLHDATTTGLGIHSIPGIALESGSAAGWAYYAALSNNEKGFSAFGKGLGWGIGTGLVLSAIGMSDSAENFPNSKFGGLLRLIRKPTETEAIFVGAGMAYPTKSVAGKFVILGASAFFGWAASWIISPDPLSCLIGKCK